MNKRLLTIGIVAVVGLTVLSGVIHGRMSNRWGPPQSSLKAAKRLAELPKQFGDWRSEETQKLSPAVANELECAGYVVRRYVNEKDGNRVDVMIILGPPVPTSAHTPQICFPAQDHKEIEGKRRVAIGDDRDSVDEFWGMTFRENTLDGNLERVYYAWSTGSRWLASDSKYAFLGRPYLYKIQAMSVVPPGTDLKKDDPCRRFLEKFVPAAKEYMIEPSGH